MKVSEIIQQSHSNVYYLRQKGFTQNKVYDPVKNAKSFKNDLGLDLFTYKNQNRETILAEGMSGLIVMTLDMNSDISPLEQFKIKIDKSFSGGIDGIITLIEKTLCENGLSDRYTKPEITKQVLFPPIPKDDNKAYLKTLENDGIKGHQFVKKGEYKGYVYYQRKGKETNSDAAYIALGEYAVYVDSLSWIEDRLQNIVDDNINVSDQIISQVKHAIQDGKSCSIGFAMYAESMGEDGVLEQVTTINQKNRDMWEEKYKKEAEERKIKEQQEIAEYKAEAESILNKIESAIRNNQEVEDEYIRIYKGDNKYDYTKTSAILHLFRKYDINVPLKTQGWIKTALAKIYYNSEIEEYSYKYYTKSANSTVFSDYLKQLIFAIKNGNIEEGVTA